MRPNRATLTLMAVLFLVGVATAHEGERHIKGTIESVQAEVLVIRTTTGEVVPLRLGGETRYETADGMATRRDRLRAGLRVVVRASEGGGMNSWPVWCFFRDRRRAPQGAALRRIRGAEAADASRLEPRPTAHNSGALAVAVSDVNGGVFVSVTSSCRRPSKGRSIATTPKP